MSTGQIHDLGYKRYVGTRRSLGTRWTVIMRHQIASAWKGWWRFKVWLICAVMVTVVTSVLLYTLQNNVFRRLSGFGPVTRFIDGILPDSTQWFCKVGFIVSLTISSMVVASDVQTGAFTFYFARSVRPRDYVLGKLAGLAVLLALIMLAGPVVLLAFFVPLLTIPVAPGADMAMHVALARGLLEGGALSPTWGRSSHPSIRADSRR